MATLLEAMISKIAWDAFSKYAALTIETVEDMALRVWIANELRKLEQLEGVSDKKIDEATDIIEATIVETPENIKEIKSANKQKEAFEKYFKENQQVKKIINNINGDVYGNVNVESGTTVTQTFNFGDVHKVPKS